MRRSAIREVEAVLQQGLEAILGGVIPLEGVKVQSTKPEFEGDYTLVVFPWVKQAKCAPEQLAERLGAWAVAQNSCVAQYSVIKGFLNVTLTDAFWVKQLAQMVATAHYGEK